MADISKITDMNGNEYNLKDASVPSWAKMQNPPTYTAADVGAVAKSGDTMTGILTASGLIAQSPNDTGVVSRCNQSGVMKGDIWLDSHPNGNHGLWSSGYYNGSEYISDPEWLILRDTSGNVKLRETTMTEPLKWADGNALSPATTLYNFLGIDSFADGGATHYITANNMRTSIGAVGTSDVIDIPHGGTGATTAARARANLGVGLIGSYTIAKDPDFSADPFKVRLFVYNGFAIIYFDIWTDIGVNSEITMFDVSDYIQPVEKMNFVFPGQNANNTLLVQIYLDGHATGYKAITGNTFYRGTITIPIIELTD